MQRYREFVIVIIKMAAVHHLGFVEHVSGPPTLTAWWSLSHTHPFNGPFFRDYPGEPVPER